MTTQERDEAVKLLDKEAELQSRRVTHCRMPKSSRAYKLMEALNRAIEALKKVEVSDG